MRLLILTPEFDGSGGGIITYYRQLAPALRACGAEVRVIEGSAFHAGARSARMVDGFSVETLERDRLMSWYGRFSTLSAAPGLRRHLSASWAMWEQAGEGQDADIVEATDWGMLFAAPAVEASTPLIVQGHGSTGQIAQHDPIAGEETQTALVQMLERALLGAAPGLQTYSAENALFWRTEAQAAPQMIRPAWAPTASPRSTGVGENAVVIGRIQRWKGPQTVCQALDLLGSRAPQIDWFGRDTPWDTPESSTARHLAARYPTAWGPRIRAHAPIGPAEVAARQAGALFNIVPSLWDVFNFTAVEAMASGRPTIVSTGAGASELLVDGENGYLYEAGDPAALAAAMDRVLSEPAERRAEIGRAAQVTVARELDPMEVARQRMAAYQAAISTFGESRPQPVGGWTGDICRPRRAIGTDDLAFLENVGLRDLASHLARRLVGKGLSRAAGARRR